MKSIGVERRGKFMLYLVNLYSVTVGAYPEMNTRTDVIDECMCDRSR